MRTPSSVGTDIGIAVIWQRFGPYHRARLSALADNWTDSSGVLGLEVASKDHYLWSGGDQQNGFQHHCCFPNQSYDKLSKTSIALEVFRALKRFDPQFVAINGWSAIEALTALAWCRISDRKTILMSETHQFGRNRTPTKDIAKRLIVRQADAGIVGGRWHADYLASLGMSRERIRIGYDAVDNQHFRQGAELARASASEIRSQYRLPERYFFVCTRFLKRKNVDGLLRAYRRYRDLYASKPFSLVIAGSGSEDNQLWQLQNTLHLQDVHWPGFVSYDELPLYYGLAEAFVHPAREEAWGLVVNEAAAVGLPLVIAKTVGAACELVEEDRNGWLFDADNHEQLAEILIRLSSLGSEQKQSMEHHSHRLSDALSTQNLAQEMIRLVNAIKKKEQM